MGYLPEDFQFSQGSLQDYVECRRRFQLRDVLSLSWPAIHAEPADEYELHTREGETFHRMVHQHQLGITPVLPEDADHLAAWWRNYLASPLIAPPPAGLPLARYPEVTLSAEIEGYRLLAKFDLVAVEPGVRAVIVDWKTAHQRTTGSRLAARLQTRVYRYLLVTAGAHLNGGVTFAPEQVSMVYWFAAFPGRPERIAYDRTTFEQDDLYLRGLVREIAASSEHDFPKTENVERCRFCAYRSLCGRGAEAGQMADDADPEDFQAAAAAAADDFDFEQIAEIAF